MTTQEEEKAMEFGAVAGLSIPVSRVVLGTVAVSTDRRDEAYALMDQFVAAGGNALDTAHVYGVDGSAERAVGEWLARAGGRSELALIVKGACTTSCTPDLVTAELDESLDRLQSDYADVYLMHRDNPAVPAGEFVEVLNEHVRSGRVRTFGGSNWLPGRIEEANAYAREHHLIGFTASSPNFSLALWNEAPWESCYTAADLPTRRWYEESGIALFAWSSQAGGFFTGRFRPEDRDDPSKADAVRVWFNDDNFRRLARAEALAAERGVAPTEIALAYVLSQDVNAFALIGPQTPAELASCFRGAAIRLSPAERAHLNLESDAP